MSIPVLQAFQRLSVLSVQRRRKLKQRASNLLRSPRTIVGKFTNPHTISQVKAVTGSRCWMKQRTHLLSDAPQMEQLRNAAPRSNAVHWQLVEHRGHGRKFGRDIGVNGWISRGINLIAGKKHHAMNFVRKIFEREQRGCIIRVSSFGLSTESQAPLHADCCQSNNYCNQSGDTSEPTSESGMIIEPTEPINHCRTLVKFRGRILA